MIQFLTFEFDEVHTILSQDGIIIPINNTQAKLLAIFIANPEKIFSKHDILTEIWHDKVVSEQVVFQNISQLRAILGENVIKTFPKKGYQWQPRLTQLQHTKPKQNHTNTEPKIIKNDIRKNRKAPPVQPRLNINVQKYPLPIIILTAFIIVCIGFGIIWFKSINQVAIKPKLSVTSTTQSEVEVICLPFISNYPNQFENNLVQLNSAFPFDEHYTNIKSREFINSPYMQYQQSNIKNGLIFTGILKNNRDSETRKIKPYLLELVVQGQRRTWTNYIYGSSMEDLAQEVKTVLQILADSHYFILENESLLSGELRSINEKMGESLFALPLLTQHLIDEKKFDAASGYIELLLTKSELTNPLNYGYGKWLKGQLFQSKHDDSNAKKYLEQADLLFSDAHLYDLQAEVNKSMAELAHPNSKEGFELIRRHLYKAASLARLSKKPVAEIRAYTLLSIKASKFSMKKERLDYLLKAKMLLAEYQMDGSHYMLPMYHFALFSDTLEQRIHFYHSVLEKPVTPENYWVFSSTAKQLSKLYLDQKKPDKALNVIKKITEPARLAFLYALYYQALGEEDEAINFAKRSFNISRSQHINWLGLESAMLTLELMLNHENNTEHLEYKTFITKHASEQWLNWNKEKLAAVGLKPFI